MYTWSNTWYNNWAISRIFKEELSNLTGRTALPHWSKCCLTLPMLKLFSSKSWGGKDFQKALAEYYQMSTHVPGFQSLFMFLHHFVLSKLATSSTKVNWFNQDILTLPMLRLLSSKAQERYDFWKTSKSCHVVIHWIALTEYPYVSHFSAFLSNIVLAKLYPAAA